MSKKNYLSPKDAIKGYLDAKAKVDVLFAEMYNEKIVNSLNDLTDEARRFNALPWWKKMFFRFDL